MSFSEGVATNQWNSKPPNFIISNNGGTTKISRQYVLDKFQSSLLLIQSLISSLQLWSLSLLLLHTQPWHMACIIPSLLCRMEIISPAHQLVKDQPPGWITCWELRWHLSMPAYVVGMAGPSRPNSYLPVVTTKGSQKVNDDFIYCPNRFKLLERHLALFPSPFMVIFF